MASAMLDIANEMNFEEPSLACAPSNVGADNLAARLRLQTSMTVGRYGPSERITSPEVSDISAHQAASRDDLAAYPD